MRPARPIYLPITLREHSTPGTQRIDVALMIEASTTMRRDLTSAERAKLDAAIEAASAFVAALALPMDQAAVVGFNGEAWIEQALTGDRAHIEAALARIPGFVRERTRIDLGFQKAHEELTSGRRKPANQPVVIVLTDGLANPEPASIPVQRAEELTYTAIRAISGIPERSAARALRWAVDARVLVNRVGGHIRGKAWGRNESATSAIGDEGVGSKAQPGSTGSVPKRLVHDLGRSCPPTSCHAL